MYGFTIYVGIDMDSRPVTSCFHSTCYSIVIGIGAADFKIWRYPGFFNGNYYFICRWAVAGSIVNCEYSGVYSSGGIGVGYNNAVSLWFISKIPDVLYNFVIVSG